MDGMNLVFLHLSDIHFRRESGRKYDIDDDLRHELLLDVQGRPDGLGKVHGILICGDIAFSGKQDEYLHARDFLNELTDGIDMEETRVWCVPGNHDVDRGCVATTPLLKAVHNGWRSENLNTLDRVIEECMGDPASSRLLLEPVLQYNKFVAAYQCSMGPNDLVWQSDFILNDGSCLKLNGLNSTIISDDLDDKCKLVLGQFQIPRREVGVTHP